MTIERLTDAELDEIEKIALTPYRQVTLPTMRVRKMIEALRALTDHAYLLQMRIDGGRAIIAAVEAAARTNVDTKLSDIMIERPAGPPFRLIDAIPVSTSKDLP